jgi:hypothetical protein
MSKDKEKIIAVITEEYVQEFVEANYKRRLTKSELEELECLLWEGDCELMDWLDYGVRQIVTGKYE